MRYNIFLLLYLSSVLPVALSAPRPVPHVYYLIKTPMTWTNAQAHCREMYDDLATVTSTDDWTKLQKEQKNNHFYSAAWVGLYNDINSWRWSFNNATLKLKKWSVADPNNEFGHEACGALDTYGYWWDINCNKLKTFLCYNESYSGRFIYISDTPKTWSNAQAYCREFHTDLATAINDSDNLILKNLVQGEWSAWFGLFRETWKWSDQSNASSINWIFGSPDNFGGEENCGSVSFDVISDVYCAGFLPFFCHIVPPMKVQEVMKLQVTSDLSLIDPLTQSSTLELIWKELRNHGMADNTTVTWRLQPDGNIFQTIKEENVESVDETATQWCKT